MLRALMKHGSLKSNTDAITALVYSVKQYVFSTIMSINSFFSTF
jgi:hypothetical protein